jgi:hypothetical protein
MSQMLQRPLGAGAYDTAWQPPVLPDGYAAARGAAVFTPVGSTSPTEPQEVRRWSDVIDELLSLYGLKDDWDGEGTPAPGPALVTAALQLAQQLQQRNAPPPDRAHASVNGTVYLEWYLPSHYIETEVVAADRVDTRKTPRTR